MSKKLVIEILEMHLGRKLKEGEFEKLEEEGVIYKKITTKKDFKIKTFKFGF